MKIFLHKFLTHLENGFSDLLVKEKFSGQFPLSKKSCDPSSPFVTALILIFELTLFFFFFSSVCSLETVPDCRATDIF